MLNLALRNTNLDQIFHPYVIKELNRILEERRNLGETEAADEASPKEESNVDEERP